MKNNSKHPLNKFWYMGFKKEDWALDIDVYTFKGKRHSVCLGNRMCSETISTENVYWTGFEVDESVKEIAIFDSYTEALKWLKTATHKEYGCRLWCQI